MNQHRGMDRREFLRVGVAGGLASGLAGRMAGGLATEVSALGSALPRGGTLSVAFVVDPSDPIASAAPVQWALGELQRALSEAPGRPAAGGAADHTARSGGATPRVRTIDRLSAAAADELCVLACGSASGLPATASAASALQRARATFAEGPERLALLRTRVADRDVVIACGSDARGLVYALLELADRVQAAGVDAGLHLADASRAAGAAIVERPTNAVRSVMRQFTSEALDKTWFNDREMWPQYLTMLATHRFNRLHLGFGLGYDFLQGVTDSYFLFLYPFLLNVPGYNVRVSNLTDAERDRNLEMLRFISDQTVARGLTFQLGVWMHGYELLRSPDARYVVEGLTADTHGAYCRDALTAVLRACPAISAVALRIHGESGVAEGSYDFWQTVFDGVKRCGRTVEIDLHAKGIDQTLINRALATGLPVNVSPKYWAEHIGLPYHQTTIRELEMPVEGKTGRGLMALSEGSRSFTRYGYADLLRNDRKYTVRFRVWDGTQKVLLSGDPKSAAAHSRMFAFGGSAGMDLMEPLTFRGRRGSGIPGSRRTGYASGELDPRWDWEKFRYWYRVWGRLTYDASADSDQCFRQFAAEPQARARAAASALSYASRILPTITTAHLPSAACDAYWPEIYWNQPLVGEASRNPYSDTPAPKNFQHVSPLDPQRFSSIVECAQELLNDERSGKYSPIEVAQWLDDLAAGVEQQLAIIERTGAGSASAPASVPSSSGGITSASGGITSSEIKRLVVDARIQAGLGRFFAAKFRAGVLYAIYVRTSNRQAINAALDHYRAARRAWAELSKHADEVYATDLSVSDRFDERGHWADRLAGIDEDIERMSQQAASAAPSPAPSVVPAPSNATADTAPGTPSAAPSATPADDARASHAIARALEHPPVERAAPCDHTPPASFHPGADVPIELRVFNKRQTASVQIYYRHVNQGERFQQLEMKPGKAGSSLYSASIPAAYTASPYALQYYFAIGTGVPAPHGWISLYPGLGHDLLQQPYFVLQPA